MSKGTSVEPGRAQYGWTRAMGVEFVVATAERVELRLSVDERHLQPMGIVHGGVYCGLIETACSVGGYLAAQQHGKLVVGVDNQTSFVKAVRGGVLHTLATPLYGGRRSALWEARVQDDAGALVATGRLRLLCLEPGAHLADEAAEVRGRPHEGEDS